MIAVRSQDSPKEVYRELLKENPNAMVVVGFEPAYVGMTVTHPVIAIYDYDECIRLLADANDCTENEAEAELIELIGECLSPESPVFARCR
jgi:hypothetical protein